MEISGRKDLQLSAPNVEGNVWPRQVCPVFEPRNDTPIGLHQCWYCRYADFHLEWQHSLEVGVCYWPKRVL